MVGGLLMLNLLPLLPCSCHTELEGSHEKAFISSDPKVSSEHQQNEEFFCSLRVCVDWLGISELVVRQSGALTHTIHLLSLSWKVCEETDKMRQSCRIQQNA
jgi:hypothetical protein